MDAAGQITVEFFGIPRLRAGRADLKVSARTLGELLAAVSLACPQLRDIFVDAQISPHYRLSLNGGQFITELEQALNAGDRVLLLSADAGG